MWEKIEKLLKEKSMTKNKLATLAGINKNSLIDLKMGRKKSLKFEDVVKIADALDISLDEFRKEVRGIEMVFKSTACQCRSYCQRGS